MSVLSTTSQEYVLHSSAQQGNHIQSVSPIPLPWRNAPAVLISVLDGLPRDLCSAVTLGPSSLLFCLDPWRVLWLLIEKGQVVGKYFHVHRCLK